MTETYIVAGAPRTGTSLIAGTMHVLGVSMGKEWKTEGTYEDIDFAKNENDSSAIADVIWSRNQSNAKWGFKWPLAWKYMWTIASELKNPHVIFAYRNIVSLLKRRPNTQIHRHLKTMGFWGAFLEIHRYPVLFLDYEVITKDPEFLVSEIVSFCKLTPTEEQLKKAIAFNTKGAGYNKDTLL